MPAQNGIVGRSLVIFGPAPDNTRLACATIKPEAYMVATAAFNGMGGITGKIRSVPRPHAHARRRVQSRTQEYNGERRRRLAVHSLAPMDWAGEARRLAADIAALETGGVKAEPVAVA